MPPDLSAITGSTWASILSENPIMLLASPSIGFPLGAATTVGPLLHEHRIEIALAPAWAWELPDVHEPLLQSARCYVQAHPRHGISFLCSNDVQTEIFSAAGWPAVTLNRNMFVNDRVFRPLPDFVPIFDAVYYGRLVDAKRHELAAMVDRLALIPCSNFEEGSDRLSGQCFHS